MKKIHLRKDWLQKQYKAKYKNTIAEIKACTILFYFV